MIRRHISFSGWVQGVGFRYRARYAASLYGCTGWGCQRSGLGESEGAGWPSGQIEGVYQGDAELLLAAMNSEGLWNWEY